MKTNEIIKLTRKSQGLTQLELAEKIGTTKNYLSLIENGHKSPSFKLTKSIATELKIPAPVLLVDSFKDIRAKNKHEVNLKNKIITLMNNEKKRFINQQLKDPQN